MDTTYGWLGTAQRAVTESTRSKQWARVPLAMVAAAFKWGGTPGTYRGEPVLDMFSQSRNTLVSADDAKQAYGEPAALRVHTVAFGSIPVEATIQVSQRRDENDLPIPIETYSHAYKYNDPSYPLEVTYGSVELADSLNVSVTALSVDGTKIDLPQRGCSGVKPAEFEVASETFDVKRGEVETDVIDLSKNFTVSYGGTLTGTIDIPSFGSCLSDDGDDIGPVLSATVSGDGNPLSIRLGATGCFWVTPSGTVPPGPGQNTPAKANCQASSSENIPSVPDEIDIPTQQ